MTITRLAPSPTGPLHIGTARTALFNFLWAKKQSGKFLLRIEDTDKTRSDEKFTQDIIDGLKWLGLKWDGEIIYQSKRFEKYQDVTKQLVDAGAAYEKDKAIWFKIPTNNGHPELDSGSQIPKRVRNDTICFDDAVRGKVSFALKDLKDFVILRRDGIPTFHLVSVVDDEEMQITDVIRGEDHLSNTPLHILIQKALGYKTPRYAHLPLILNPDRTKMSKRTAPTSITADFRSKGYLPEAMINFLALLGWNPKVEQEFFTLDELIQKFDLSGIQKANAIFDASRLNWFNQHYLRQMPDEEVVKWIQNQLSFDSESRAKRGSSGGEAQQFSTSSNINIFAYVRTFKDRAQTLNDFMTLGNFIFNLPEYPKELLIFKKSNQGKTRQGLAAAKSALAAIPDSDWNQDKLHEILIQTVADANLANGDVFWPTRAALSGLDKSPSPAEILQILGKDESLHRLQIAIEKNS